jgi:TonB family protein
VLTGLGLAGVGRQGGGLATGVIDFDLSWLFPEGGLRSMNPKRLRARAEKERFAARESSPHMPEKRQSVAWTASVGRDLIRGVVNRNKPDVRRCFRDGMAHNPGLTGEVEVAFTIQSDGAVAYASVARSTLADATVEACVTETVKRWQFPVFVASGGDVDVRFPFAVGKA